MMTGHTRDDDDDDDDDNNNNNNHNHNNVSNIFIRQAPMWFHDALINTSRYAVLLFTCYVTLC